jgi:hypothetical protein
MNMKWLLELLENALAQLKRGETWLFLGLLATFGLLTYAVSQFAFKTDSVLRQLHHSMASCRELTNGPIIFLFCGMIFFLLFVVITLGEFQRYFDFRKRGAYYEARHALWHGIGWSVIALGIPLAALLFFHDYCR